MSLIPKDSFASLEHEYGILRLIYHRNKNQHRVATWWKYLNSLKRYHTKLISLLHTYNRKNNDKIRTKILKVASHLYFDICKGAYRAFNGIIALGQFITLGLTLIGVLGKIYNEVGKIEGLHVAKAKSINRREESKVGDVDDLNADLGEEIVIQDVKEEKKRKSVEPMDFGVKKKKKKITELSVSSFDKDKKKKKKKKNKSAIDDIFG